MPFIYKMDSKIIEESAKLKFHIGTYLGIDVVSLFCGVCKVNAAIATQILISKYDVTHILVVGVAGAIDKTLKLAGLERQEERIQACLTRLQNGYWMILNGQTINLPKTSKF